MFNLTKAQVELLKNFKCCLIAAMDDKENVHVVAGGDNLDFPHLMVIIAELMGTSIPAGMADDEMFWGMLKGQVKRISAERK